MPAVMVGGHLHNRLNSLPRKALSCVGDNRFKPLSAHHSRADFLIRLAMIADQTLLSLSANPAIKVGRATARRTKTQSATAQNSNASS